MNRISLNGNDWKMKEFIGMDWVWRDSVMPDTKDVRWWEPARVPGSVLHDLITQDRVPDPYYELNSKLVEWVPERTWVYKKEFAVSGKLRGKTIFLCFEGIDYEAQIFLNGVFLGRHEGMFIPWEKDVTEHLKYGEQNLVAAVIEPAPKEQPQVGKTSLVKTHKSRMTYWWDFCPRMIHQGIWKPVWLHVTEGGAIENVYLTADLNEDNTQALLHLELEADLKALDEYYVEGAFGDITFREKINKRVSRVEWKVENPRLWWVNGYGEPYEYPVWIRLTKSSGTVCDERKFLFGIRDIRFGLNEGTENPKGEFLLYLNGRKLYMNGYNWVPCDVLYGVSREQKMRHLLRLAKEAGVNILRVWGGGLIEKDSFYEECAKNGILIWQEFILSSSGIDNKTPDSETYKSMIEKQAEIILKQKRNHTSLAVWCGGNELQDENGRPLDNNDPVLAALKEQQKRWDPKRKWLPTSPSGGVFLNSLENIRKYPDKLLDVHGPWEHQGLKGHCRLYNQGVSLLHTEFGVEGMCAYSTLRKVTAQEHLFPANKDNEVYFHRGAWWNNEPLVQETFGGNLSDIESIRKGSQYLQYEGLKYAVECNRRRAFKNSGTFPWQLNEPYPNLFCTSAVDYYGIPKPAYYGIKKAYAPYRITAAFDSPVLKGKTCFTAALYAGCNGKGRELRRCWVHAELLDGYGQQRWYREYDVEGLSQKDTKAADICQGLKDFSDELVLLRLKLGKDGFVLAENEYLFTMTEDLSAVFAGGNQEIQVDFVKGSIILKNPSSKPIWFIYLSREDGEMEFYPDNNYFCLMPGEKKQVNAGMALNKISVQALNGAYTTTAFLDKKQAPDKGVFMAEGTKTAEGSKLCR